MKKSNKETIKIQTINKEKSIVILSTLFKLNYPPTTKILLGIFRCK